MLFMCFLPEGFSAMDPPAHEFLIQNNIIEKYQLLRLYHPFQIAILSFLGTPFAGLLAIAFNYRAIGQHKVFFRTLAVSVILLFLIILLYVYLPRTPYDRLFPGVMALFLSLTSYQLFFARMDKNNLPQRQSVTKMILLILVGLMVSMVSLMLAVSWLAI